MQLDPHGGRPMAHLGMWSLLLSLLGVFSSLADHVYATRRAAWGSAAHTNLHTPPLGDLAHWDSESLGRRLKSAFLMCPGDADAASRSSLRVTTRLLLQGCGKCSRHSPLHRHWVVYALSLSVEIGWMPIPLPR